jgi:hypothetical protein
MARIMKKSVFTVSLIVMLMSVPAFAGSINKSIKIEAGAKARSASTVNGSITVGADAVVSGDLDTVNGSIRIGRGATLQDASTVNGSVKVADNAKTRDLDTVNGGIRVRESVTVDGSIDAVNGGISIGKSSTVAKSVSSVNGSIELSGAIIEGDVSTVFGNVSVLHDAVIRGDLIVEKPSRWGWNRKKMRKPKIIIGPGSHVEGAIVLEHEVELFISDTASVGSVSGVMNIDQAVRFSGERP